MRKFRFSMESVLRLRRQQEDQALERLADAVADQQAAKQRVAATDRQIAEALARPAADVQGAISRETFVDRLTSQRSQQQWELSQAQDALQRAQHDAMTAQAQRKAVERLRERHMESWKQEMGRQEDRVLNEAAMSRAFRAGAAR